MLHCSRPPADDMPSFVKITIGPCPSCTDNRAHATLGPSSRRFTSWGADQQVLCSHEVHQVSQHVPATTLQWVGLPLSNFRLQEWTIAGDRYKSNSECDAVILRSEQLQPSLNAKRC